MRKFVLLILLPITLVFWGEVQAKTKIKDSPNEQLFTVNFNNISIKEYLKFLSEIGKINFIYDESELNFKFTLQSDQPASLDVLKTALVQVLRIHDFHLIEDQNNILITKSTKVKSVYPIIRPGQSLPRHEGAPPIITNVLKIKFREPEEIVKLITPLLSESAFIEVSKNTSQIIISDTLNSLSNIQNLLEVIDSPDLAYNYAFYTPHDSNALDLANMAEKILTPLTNNATYFLFPNVSSRQIVIVAKEGMIKVITSLLDNLDRQGPPAETFTVQIESSVSPEHMKETILSYAKLMDDKNPLKKILLTAKWSSDLHVFLFKGPTQQVKPTTDIVNKIEKLIENKQETDNVFHYQIKYTAFDVLKSALNAYATKLPPSNPERIMIENMSYTKNLNFIIFKGNKKTYDHIQTIIESVDNASNPIGVHTYNIEHAPEKLISHSLVSYANAMPEESTERQMIEQRKYLPETKQFVFTGTNKDYDKLEVLIKKIDITKAKPVSAQVFTYNIINRVPSIIIDSLNDYANIMPKDSNERKMIESKKYLPHTKQLVFTGSKENFAEIDALIKKIDIPIKNQTDVFAYNIINATPTIISHALDQYANAMPKDSPERLMIESKKYLPHTKQLVFTGSKENFTKVDVLIKQIDIPKAKHVDSHVFTYNIINRTPSVIIDSLNEYASVMPKDSKERLMIESKKYLPHTKQLVFTGSKENFAEIDALIKKIDIPIKNQTDVFTYNITNATPTIISQALDQYAEVMPKDSPERKMIESKKYLPHTKQLVFTGSKEDYAKIDALIKKIDIPIKNQTDVFTYNITNATPTIISQALDQYAEVMPKDSPERKMIESKKYLPHTKQLVFTGSKEEYAKIDTLIKKIDTPEKKHIQSEVFTYNIVHASDKLITQSLDQYAKAMKKGSPERIMIESKKYLANTHQFIFSGSKDDYTKIDNLIKKIDIPEKKNDQFAVLKLKPQANPTEILKEVSKAASQLQKKSLIDSIHHITYQKSNNSFLISGTPEDIKQIKILIEGFEKSGEKEAPASTFEVVPLHYIPAEQAVKELQTTANHLSKTHMDDPSLITTIKNVHPTSKGNSLMVVGSTKNIESVKKLITSIDDQSKVADKSSTSVISYKIRNQPYSYISKNIKHVVSDLSKHNNPKDKPLIRTLNTLRYVPESHIIIITGTKTTLDQALKIIEKIDIPSHHKVKVAKGQVYIIYKVKNTTAENVMCAVKDFEHSLRQTGSNEDDLFEVLSTLKPLPSNNSILINAPNKELLEKAENIVAKFDVPYDTDNQAPITTGRFVSFKLNYQMGKSISGGLYNIGDDLKKSPKASEYATLIQAIKSISYIKETNSLLLFGEPPILTQLKQIIDFLDVPLIQVFIEVLVITVADVDTLQIGLQWGVNGTYQGKFGGSTGSMSTDTTSTKFINTIAQNGTQAITGSSVPIISNGSIGGIGNLLFHKGQSYLTFGALASALKQEADDNLVFNTKLITQDGLSSTIFVGQNVPYTGSIVTTAGLTNQTNANLEYRDIGFNLTITPIVGRDESISLDIVQSISDAVGGGSGGSSTSSNTVQGITTNMTNLTTKVRVPNNHFVVLGGQFRNTHSSHEQKVPCLGGLPLIGAAFSYNNDTLERTDTMIFIKPSIVTDTDDKFNYDAVTKRQEEILASRMGAEDIAQGLELLQSPCDDDDEDDEDDEDY